MPRGCVIPPRADAVRRESWPNAKPLLPVSFLAAHCLSTAVAPDFHAGMSVVVGVRWVMAGELRRCPIRQRPRRASQADG